MEQDIKTIREERPLMVTIRCITYNHEPYIRQCLEGFVMQKTNFRFEAIVHDDASTDGTADIIREYAEKYPDIIKPIYETENQYSKHDGSLRKIMDAHTHGKYVAMCEGDDYWTDPLKLQKQVDFLEGNPEYSMCFTDCYHYIQISGKKEYKPYTKKTIVTLIDLLYKRNMVNTLTSLFKRELLQGYTEIYNPKWPMGDYPLWIWMSYQGPIHRIKEITAVYRILQVSASHAKNENGSFFFGLAGYEIRLYFAKLLRKSAVPIIIKRDGYIIKFVVRRFWRQLDKLKYLFIKSL